MDILWKKFQKDYERTLESGDKSKLKLLLEKVGNDLYSDILKFAMEDARNYKNINGAKAGILATNLTKEAIMYYNLSCGSLYSFASEVVKCANRALVRNPEAVVNSDGSGIDPDILCNLHPLVRDVVICTKRGTDAYTVLVELTKGGCDAFVKMAMDSYEFYEKEGLK